MVTNSSEAGKGDRYRKVNWEKYSENYDRVFGKTRTKKYPKTSGDASRDTVRCSGVPHIRDETV